MNRVIQTVDPLSPSLALNQNIIQQRWIDHFKNVKFMKLARSLGPSYLRVGGITADEITFVMNSETRMKKSYSCSERKLSGRKKTIFSNKEKVENASIVMTEGDWKKLNEFCSSAGWKLIFDLNLLKRNGSRWNYTNAQQLIKFTENRYHVNWELGNEPNSYPHNMGTTISPEQVGEGFKQLRKLLQASPWWESSVIVGPDLNHVGSLNAAKFLSRFLKAAGHTIDGITYHQYDMNGNVAELADFLNPHILHRIRSQTQQILDVRSKYAPDKSVWLGETASAYDGGVKGVSNSFADGFTWLDKLGTVAQMGVDVVMRQSLFEGSYALIDKHFDPLPDYWLTFLYKQLVGNKVLKVTQIEINKKNDNEEKKVRIYAHCTKDVRYSKGSVVLYFINLKNTTIYLSINSLKNRGAVIDMYLLTPGEKRNITSKSIRLNGVTLKLSSTNTFPRLRPTRIDESKLKLGIKIPSFTYGFLVLSGANAYACLPMTLK
ncbi:heparanase-like [Ciona intestinalis]